MTSKHVAKNYHAALLEKASAYWPHRSDQCEIHPDSPRFTSNRQCRECKRIYAREYARTNKMRGYQPKSKDEERYNHRGAPTNMITIGEIRRIDLTPGR